MRKFNVVTNFCSLVFCSNIIKSTRGNKTSDSHFQYFRLQSFKLGVIRNDCNKVLLTYHKSIGRETQDSLNSARRVLNLFQTCPGPTSWLPSLAQCPPICTTFTCAPLEYPRGQAHKRHHSRNSALESMLESQRNNSETQEGSFTVNKPV